MSDLDQALRRLRQRRRRALAVEHREQIDTQDALRAVDDQLRLHRLRVVGQLELTEPALAPHERLHIKAGQALSVQYHERKDETVYLLSGELRYWVALGDAPLDSTRCGLA